MAYSMTKKMDCSFDEAIDKLKEAIENAGFGIISELNLQEKIKKKIDVDVGRYMLFGVCNPNLAKKALDIDHNMGLLLPCKASVYEKEGLFVSILMPEKAMKIAEDENLAPVAKEAQMKLEKAFGRL